jgi:hypothetical protein
MDGQEAHWKRWSVRDAREVEEKYEKQWPCGSNTTHVVTADIRSEVVVVVNDDDKE